MSTKADPSGALRSRWSEASVEAHEVGRCNAMIAGDGGQLRSIFAEDATWVHSSGQVDSQESFITKIESGEVRYIEIGRTEAAVRIYGDCAISSGVAAMRAVAGTAERRIRNRYTNVWINEPCGQRLVSCQSTKLD